MLSFTRILNEGAPPTWSMSELEDAVEPGVVPRRSRLPRRGLQGRCEAHRPEGASLEDPAALFNGSLGGNTTRALDVFPAETEFRALVRAAVVPNEP